MLVVLVVLACAGGGGCGATTPIVGTSPANVGTERATARAAAIASRFIFKPPIGDCQTFYIGGN